MIKTYRGILLDGGQDKIRLKTIKGEIGYRIVKFDIIPQKPVTAANECVVQIWKVSQGDPPVISSEIDFSDQTLLGIGIYSNQTDTTYYPDDQTVIFDSEIFNQDIYITHKNETGAVSCNYYLQLEQVPLNENETTMTTLQSLRQVAER